MLLAGLGKVWADAGCAGSNGTATAIVKGANDNTNTLPEKGTDAGLALLGYV